MECSGQRMQLPGQNVEAGSVTIALAISFILEGHNFHRGALPLFLFAVALSAWYGGVGPAMLAIALSILSFDYYFARRPFTASISLARRLREGGQLEKGK